MALVERPQVDEDVGFMHDRHAAAFLPRVRTPVTILYACTAFVLAAFAWAAIAEIGEVTVGEGKVIPSSQVQQIQHLEGGIVKTISVRVGQMVKKGDTVMQLDRKRFSSSLGESQAKHIALSLKVARLTAEASGQVFTPDPKYAQQAPDLVAQEQLLYSTRQHDLDTTLSVLRQTVAQKAQEISEKQGLLAQLESSRSLLNKEIALTRPMVEQKIAADVDLLRLQRQLADLEGQLTSTRLSIPRLQEALGEARSKVMSAEARFRSDAAKELSDAGAELSTIDAGNEALVDRLDRATLRSPVNGIVKSIAVNTVGGVIQPGVTVMEIVPIEDNLLIEAKIRPADVGFLRPGQSAKVKLSAYDYSIYGELDATLENITADSFTNERDKQESYYLVQVRTKRNYLGTAEKPLPIIPGMLATVYIQTGNKTVLSYLMKPITKARLEAMRER
ncbi:HlyD family type I secretion periplasmic adaptor subunit [Chitinibacteraceae bacterium HSL-7]